MSEVVVSIHQPNFMPWLKLLDKVLASDVFIAYDTVQYTRSEYHSRQRVKTIQGAADWLSVPLLSKRGSPPALIREVRIDNSQPFRPRHLRRLRLTYGRTPYFAEVYALIEEVYRRNQEFLVDLNLDLLHAFCEYLRSPVRIVRAHTLTHDGDNTDRIIQLVQAVAGDVHLTSTFGPDRTYICWPEVRRAGIAVRTQEFTHPSYDQPFGPFVPQLAAVDMLFCAGPRTAQLLEANRRLIDIGEVLPTAQTAGTGDRQPREARVN